MRPALVVALVLSALAAVAGAYAYAARTRTVTLSVDGRVYQVETFGDAVEDVLHEEGIELGRHDAVAPSPGSEVSDGSRIAVRFGRQLSLTVDGDEQTYWVTATMVSAALDQIGRRFADAFLSASRSAPIGRQGLALTVKTEKDIALVHGGRTSQEVTTAVTVGAALQDLEVAYDGDDEVTPGPGTQIDDGSRLRVVRIDKRTRKVRVDVPKETVVRYDDDLLEGRTKVRRAGRDGVRVDTYRVVLADGERRGRTRLASTVRTEPVDRVVVRGTREREVTPTPVGISDAPCPSGSGVEAGLTSNAIAVHRAVCAEFPEVESYLGLRVGDDDEHGQGRALDMMVYSDSALGDAIAAWVRAHHARLGISEVIWSQRIWTVQRSSEGWRWMPDMGSSTANHYDHVHVTVY